MCNTTNMSFQELRKSSSLISLTCWINVSFCWHFTLKALLDVLLDALLDLHYWTCPLSLYLPPHVTGFLLSTWITRVDHFHHWVCRSWFYPSLSLGVPRSVAGCAFPPTFCVPSLSLDMPHSPSLDLHLFTNGCISLS